MKRPVEMIGGDVVVVGGGLAGVCAAVAAARRGAKTILIQDRPVLGGNSSAEIGVPIHGANQQGQFRHVRETGLLDEMFTAAVDFPNCIGSSSIWSLSLWAFCRGERNLTVLLNTRVRDPELEEGRIVSVVADQSTTEKRFRIAGKVFIDCSGDGELGFRAGAEFMRGRESKARFGENLAAEEADEKTMGNTVYLWAKDLGRPVPFKAPAWAHPIASDAELPDGGMTCPHEVSSLLRQSGGWWWIEFGGEMDTIADAETIRDELYRYAIGLWDHVKNRGDHGAENLVLERIGALPGKRESRRFVGPHVLTQADVEVQRTHADIVAYGGWHIDMHYPTGMTGPSYWFGKLIRLPYGIPFRCLYSTNVRNLLFAGRNISASHVAFGSSRVMATCAVLGQAAGNAAALCVEHDCPPAEVQARHVDELQQRLLAQDCYIPGVRDVTAGNLARIARVAASSDTPLVFPEPTEYRNLDVSRGQAFFVSANRIESASFWFENAAQEPRIVTASLRTMGRIDDFTGEEDLATATVEVPPGRSLGVFTFGVGTVPGAAHWICIASCRDVAVGYSIQEPPATQATHQVNQYFTPLGSALFMQRVRGSYCVKLEPESRCFAPDEVISGVARPEFRSNLWIGGPGFPQWIDLTWQNPVEIRQIHLTFDNDLDRPLSAWAENGHAPALIRNYDIGVAEGEDLRSVVSVADNVARKRIHSIDPVVTRRLRITVNGTWGSDRSRVFEIRVY